MKVKNEVILKEGRPPKRDQKLYLKIEIFHKNKKCIYDKREKESQTKKHWGKSTFEPVLEV